MREIKFRAWDGKSMEYFSLEKFGLGTVRYDIGDEIMQYTGLKDKNGKEIYEGDVVKGSYPDLGEVKFGHHETSTDYYASGAYGWFIETPETSKYTLIVQNDTEIIGNIYEQPELLK